MEENKSALSPVFPVADKVMRQGQYPKAIDEMNSHNTQYEKETKEMHHLKLYKKSCYSAMGTRLLKNYLIKCKVNI